MTGADGHTEEMRRWVAVWERAGKALAEVRRRELRTRSEAEYAREAEMVNEVYKTIDIAALPERPCGMVEMQRVFKRMAGRG